MQNKSKEHGFTLIELLLVVVIIGILLAVIVPRAWRANVDSKYGLVRQNATELASFASQWAEQMMEAQNLDSEARLIAYYKSLAYAGGSDLSNAWGADTDYTAWIADDSTSNWNNDASTRVGIAGRVIGTTDPAPVEATVEDLVPPERLPRNPFNGGSVLRDDPSTVGVTPGAIACGGAEDNSSGGNWAYFALVFQGTDSTTTDSGDDDSFHAGMGTENLAGLRNGIFMARIQFED